MMEDKIVEKDLNAYKHINKPSSPYVAPNSYTIKGILTGILSLLQGMALTFSYLINPKKIVTQQYPENRDTLQMAQRFRGQVIMPHDEEGEHKCTGCTLCEKACPNGTISVLNKTNTKGKKVLGKYIYRLDQCTLCNLCIEACPFDAIHMGREFEFSTQNKDDLTLILNKKEGRC